MRACAEKCNASCVEVGGARRRRHQSGRRCSGWCSRRCAAHLVRASSGTVEDREEDAPPRSLAIGWLSEPRVEPGHARLPCAMIGQRLADRRHDCEEDVHTHTQRNMHGESLGNSGRSWNVRNRRLSTRDSSASVAEARAGRSSSRSARWGRLSVAPPTASSSTVSAREAMSSSSIASSKACHRPRRARLEARRGLRRRAGDGGERPRAVLVDRLTVGGENGRWYAVRRGWRGSQSAAARGWVSWHRRRRTRRGHTVRVLCLLHDGATTVRIVDGAAGGGGRHAAGRPATRWQQGGL